MAVTKRSAKSAAAQRKNRRDRVARQLYVWDRRENGLNKGFAEWYWDSGLVAAADKNHAYRGADEILELLDNG